MKSDKFTLTDFLIFILILFALIFVLGLMLTSGLSEPSKDTDGIYIVESGENTLHILNNDGTTTDIPARKINDRNFETYDGRHISVPESTRWYYEERR